ncbi:MAG: ribonuclease III [Oscillospiraceae bacterium]|nr:ribonuclease III [Oscillospiraceae bacterium]
MSDRAGQGSMTKSQAKNVHPIALAFYGDCVYEVLVRRRVVLSGANVRKLHALSVEKVRASYQAAGARMLMEQSLLSEEEMDILRRGRNAKSPVPKSATVGDYRLATGLEALFGYLSLIGDDERVSELFELVFSSSN